MLLALGDSGSRIRARPGATAICPLCESEMIAKCGRIKIWHWAHKSKCDCDAWSGPETEWHLKWKEAMHEENVEVTIERDGIRHRADIIRSDGTVVELQHSSLSRAEVQERELFYGKMVWLFDVRKQARRYFSGFRDGPGRINQLHLSGLLDPTGRPWLKFWHEQMPENDKLDRAMQIEWRWPLAYVLAAEKPRYLDLGNGKIMRLVLFRRYVNDGWGYVGSEEELVNWLASAS